MTQKDFFSNAKWLTSNSCTRDSFLVLRGHFNVNSADKVILNILGLGFFKCYINGACIDPDTFLPLSSDFEASCDPSGEVLSGHRIYVVSYDITNYVEQGDNSIAIHFGGGWYTFRCRAFGDPKAIYRISVHNGDAVSEFVSDESCKIANGFISNYQMDSIEEQNYVDFAPCFDKDFDDNSWENAIPAKPLDTEYCQTDCPTDSLIRVISPKLIKKDNVRAVYDCGVNTTGYPVLSIPEGNFDKVTVHFSECITNDGELDDHHRHNQRFIVHCDGKARITKPEFTWFGFRYFEVIGNAQPVAVNEVYANVPISSTFDCDNETLNWIYKTFMHTMHCNMHTGHPSDCPHLERRGYTGDGQLTCNAALTVFDGKEFYEKWLCDIGDCQDVLSGHVQYTAPYLHSGGGPGGWGGAIVEVPYQMYKHYGDKKYIEKYYNNMLRYIDYLEAHSEFGLVTSDRQGCWCLGDWCGPNILYPEKDITSHNQQVILPAPMVNTYFMVKWLDKICEIASIIGKDNDIPTLAQKAQNGRKIIQAAYYNAFDNNFIMNVQGANAFAVDIGIGGANTYANMVRYYKKLGHYDTGIFATDILTRVLFEHGDADLAIDLLTHNGDQGFEHWRQNGATTFHEYWDSNRSRSHSHPMFGAPVAYLFEYILGIRQKPQTAGYSSVIIEPVAVERFSRMSGSISTPNGIINVKYKHDGDKVNFTIIIPSDVDAVFKYLGNEYTLCEGENTYII